jgi:hypothetical protein
MESSRLLYSMMLTTATQASEESFGRLRTKRDDDDRCSTFCTMSLLFWIGALVTATRQPSSPNARLQAQDGNTGADWMTAKTSNRSVRPWRLSDALIGDSAAPDGLLKLCGSDLKPENRRRWQRHVVLLR